MKKFLILIVVLLGAAVAAAPAAVGWLLHDRLENWARENTGQVMVDQNRGWMRSSTRVRGQGFDLDLQFRHGTVGPPSLLLFEGLARFEGLAATLELSGRVSGGGTLHLDAVAGELDVSGDVVWRFRRPRLRLVASRAGMTNIEAGSELLSVFDGLGNSLALEPVQLEIEVQADDSVAAAALRVEARRPGEDESHLELALSEVDRASLDETIEHLRALLAAQPDSGAQAMAVVGILNGWQQMIDRGLRLDRATIQLDGEFRARGEWRPGSEGFRVRGGGPRRNFREWWANLHGLSQRLPPGAARREIDDRLRQLAEQGWLSADGNRIELAPIEDSRSP